MDDDASDVSLTIINSQFLNGNDYQHSSLRLYRTHTINIADTIWDGYNTTDSVIFKDHNYGTNTIIFNNINMYNIHTGGAAMKFITTQTIEILDMFIINIRLKTNDKKLSF